MWEERSEDRRKQENVWDTSHDVPSAAKRAVNGMSITLSNKDITASVRQSYRWSGWAPSEAAGR